MDSAKKRVTVYTWTYMERCSSIDGFIDLFFFTQEGGKLIASSHLRSSQKISGATTGLPSHNSTSQGVWTKPVCWQSQEKNTNESWRVLVYISGVCMFVCLNISSNQFGVECFYSLRFLYRGDQSLRKDQRYLSGRCRSSCMTLAAVGFLRTSTLGPTWSRWGWNRRSEGVGF